MSQREDFEKWYIDDQVSEVMEIARVDRTEAERRLQQCLDLGLEDAPEKWKIWQAAQAAVIVHLPPMSQGAGLGGRLVATLAKSMHAQYVKAIEAAGAKVAQ